MFNNCDSQTNGELKFFSSIKDRIQVVFDVGCRSDSEFINFTGDVHYFDPVNEFIEKLKIQKISNKSSYFNNFGLGEETKEIYYYVKPFTKSFFKLDFYDSKEATIQTNYFTVIIPVQQGFTVTAITTSLMPPVNIKTPSFKLDYVGDKEGFFLYWLRKKKFLNINPDPTNTTQTFYMTAKFFDARLGIFVKMMTTPQVLPLVPSLFQFNPKKYFYYKVVLDYTDYTYKIFDDVSGNTVGDLSSIKWYEYINP